MRIPGFAERAPWEVVKLAVKDFLDDDMATYAAALSFHVLLALFPFIIFLLTLLGATGLAPFFDQLLGQARVTLPPDAFQILEQVVGEIRNRPGQGILSFSIVLALWAASAGMRSVTNALNRAYDVDETRPIWQRYPLSVLYTVGLAALVLLSGAARLAGPQVVERVTNRFGITSHIATLWTWLRWPAVVALLLLVVALIYYLGPNVDQSFRYVTPGSVTALIVWIIASAGFSAYIERFGDYGATYGSLGGMIVLLLYFFVSGAVLLFGAEINAVIHPAERTRTGTLPGTVLPMIEELGICEEPRRAA
ncbi:MAG: YihY/virulence factor BrkB family protein [Thermomicrobiales bacterium]|nr:YihY/virulence factor BrkB family protein [Thermomicrobiales bacterium]